MLEMKVPSRVLLNCNLSTDQKLLYLLIYNFRDGNGYFDLSKDLLKMIMRTGFSKISDNYLVLVRFGFIEAIYDRGRNPRIRLVEE